MTKRKRLEIHAELPERPSEPRRRSSRRLTTKADVASAEEVTPIRKRTKSKNVVEDEQPLKSKKNVQQVMKELSHMEEKLIKDVKNQRSAIEHSELHIDEDVPNKTDLMGKQAPASGTIVNDESPSEGPDKIEKAPMDDNDAELALEDLAEPKGEDAPERGAKREPPVHSDYLPLPWKGRLGYACLNTYLRAANPPVFSSRTCRISSIIEHRHPLADPSQPEHATKNRPNKDKPADVARGMKWVQELGLANARDISKMIRWNDKYGIKFMRLSSEMFPFASHDEYGYKLAPFASETLAEAGKVIGELGHRVTTHPGQFTQIGSPRKEVVAAAIRDLDYHDELLSLLKLPEQQNRDAVMILHLGGVFGDKAATLDRFRHNYKQLSDSVKRRLVLENDDVSWSMHDLLPVCEELNIPFVLDYHHHNIVHDSSIREGTQDVQSFYDRIRKTWDRKGITQKMHYSEPTSPAVTPRDRRKHSARVRTLPPCAPDMDLMIEAKDKEQAVFDLMRHFKLPGWQTFNNVVPHEREDESRKAVRKKKSQKKKTPKKKQQKKQEDQGSDGPVPAVNGNIKEEKGEDDVEVDDDIEIPERIVSEADFGMGGPQSRVYWPEGMEEWLRPKKRETTKKSTSPDVRLRG